MTADGARGTHPPVDDPPPTTLASPEVVVFEVEQNYAGWTLARSGVSEAGMIHLSLTQRHCEGADLQAESEELWATMMRQDAVAGFAGAASLVALLAGGLLGIWL